MDKKGAEDGLRKHTGRVFRGIWCIPARFTSILGINTPGIERCIHGIEMIAFCLEGGHLSWSFRICEETTFLFE